MDASGPRETLRYRLALDEARPRREDVQTVLGYARDAAPAPVREAIADLLAGPEERWAIEGGGVLFDEAAIDVARGTLGLDGVVLDVGRTVAGQLSRAEGAFVFVCTAGPGIQEHSRRLMDEGDPFTAYVADAVGSLVVDAAMDRVHDRVEALAAGRGLKITNRYSPGYCGWHVREQQKLFSLLPAGFCGVRLSDTSLMQPIKSVSGVIGLGADVRRNPYTCRLCGLEDCLYRRLQEEQPAGA